MAMMKFKNSNGEWMSIPAFKGDPGKDGAIQYKAGDGIKIENDTITAEVTKDYIDDKLEELGGMGFTPEIAESLPTENIDEKTIYMIPGENGSGDNIYEEWMYINNKWEMIGSTSVDLSNYYTKDESIKTFVIERKFAPNDGQRTYSTIPDAELEVCNKMIECAIKGEPFVVYFKNLYENNATPSTFVYKYTTGYEQGDNYFQIKFCDFVGLRKTDVWYRITVDTTTNQVVTSGTKLLVQTTEDRLGDITSTTSVTGMWTFNNPTNDLQPATKKYVDDAVASMEAPESNIVDLDISGFKSNMFEMSGSGTGYASSNEHVKAALEKIARLGEANCIILIRNPYGAALCTFTSHYNHSNGGFGAYYTGIYQEQASGSNGVKYSVTIMYSADGSPANIKVQSDTLEGYITPNNVLAKTNTKAFTPTANYHPATKKYVDDAITNSSKDAKGFYHIGLDLGEINAGSDWTENFLPVACLPELEGLINKIITDGVKQPIVVIENTSEVAQGRTFLFNIMSVNQGETNTTSYHFQGLMDYVKSLNDGKQTTYDVAALLDVNGEMVDGKFEIYEGENTCLIQCASSSCLTLFNELEFTPTGDYNPATKKYVDDSIANAGGNSTNINNIYELVSSHNLGTSNSDLYEVNDKVLEAMNKYLKGEINIPSFRVTALNSNTNINSRDVYLRIRNVSNLTYTYFGSHLAIQESGFDNTLMLHNYSMTFTLTQDSTTGNYVLSGSISWDYNRRRILADGINASYTPTGDYHPATKKYVDDAVAGASGGITSESDPVFKASEAYKITSTDTANWNSKVDINAVNNAINTILSGKSYLTSEKDPTVPSWAKQPNKPTYTASEVGALPASTVIPTVPTKLSGFDDDLGTSPKHSHSQYLTAHQDISGKQNKVLYGTADPTSDIGAEGDIYIKYV